MTDTVNDEPEGTEEVSEEIKSMGQEELWRMAQKFHEEMAQEIEQPGDMIGVCAIVFTNMLIGGVMAGADMGFVDYMLRLIREDVDNGVKHLQSTMSTVQ